MFLQTSWDFIDLFVRMILVASNRKSHSNCLNKGNLLAHATEKNSKVWWVSDERWASSAAQWCHQGNIQLLSLSLFCLPQNHSTLSLAPLIIGCPSAYTPKCLCVSMFMYPVSLNSSVIKFQFLSLYTYLSQIIVKCTFFSSTYGTFFKIDHILGHNTSLSKFKRIYAL